MQSAHAKEKLTLENQLSDQKTKVDQNAVKFRDSFLNLGKSKKEL